MTVILVLLNSIGYAQSPKPQLTIYTYDSFNSEWGPAPVMSAAFEQQCHCTLKWYGMEDAGSLLTRLKMEGNNSKADIVLGLDHHQMAEATALQIFKPLSPQLLALHHQIKLPIAWESTLFQPLDWSWFAFIYDKNKLKNPPTSMHALLNRNDLTLLAQDPRTSTPGLGLLIWINTLYPDNDIEAWRKMHPKFLTITKGWSESYGLFLKGEADMVLSYTTSPTYHELVEKNTQYAAALFEEGHPIQIEMSGILKTSQQPQLAEQFMQFLTEQTAQTALAEHNWMYPAFKSAYPLAAAYSRYTPQKTASISASLIAKQRKTWLENWLSAIE